MVGPTGIAALYINATVHNEIQPYLFGGGMVFSVDFDKATWQPMPKMLEAGTPPIAQAVGFGAAIDYLNNNIDFDVLQKYQASLCAQFIDGLQTIKGARVLGPVEQLKKQGHLVSFVIDGIHSHDVAAYLSMHGIFVRAGIEAEVKVRSDRVRPAGLCKSSHSLVADVLVAGRELPIPA